MGEARNAIIVWSADAVIAIGGSWGTLSEIALANRRGGIPVIHFPGRLASTRPREQRNRGYRTRQHSRRSDSTSLPGTHSTAALATARMPLATIRGSGA
ncbi:MAG: hypothetical protein JO115_14350 [Pseudonocardiales bacterium]|nr:hypothetical protein [Pseudonocardiales bacterium]